MDKTGTVAPYSDSELKQALESLLSGSKDPSFDSRHIEGHGDSNHKLSMLQTITATRILDYNNTTKSKKSVEQLLEELQSFSQQHGPILNLQTVIQEQSPRMALAAEFKRASPSKGAIAMDLKAGDQAMKYASAGANIISVLTEERWFKGSLLDLTEARMTTNTVVPVRPAILRKDFVINKYMIAEAAAAGADTVLLIVAVLPQYLLKDLIEYTRALNMEPLVEVHADSELEVALEAGAKVIGVNNRNLHTFQMDLATSERVAHTLCQRGLAFHHTEAVDGADYTLCALSGMSTAFDVDRYRQVGLGMCLIGESLMRAADPVAAITNLCLDPKEFKAMQSLSQAGGAYTKGTQIVKVCGVTCREDALVACRAGANMIGVIFAEKSKRKVTVEQAKAVVDAVRTFGERTQRTEFKLPSGAGGLSHLIQCSRALEDGTRRPVVVGVFQNQPAEFIREMVETCELDLVQLHGSEGMAAANVKICGVPALRVVDISVDPETGKSSENAVKEILESVTNDPIAILMDTSLKGQKDGGGTGLAFDWTIAQRVQDSGLPVIIAGGLTAESIDECVRTIRPFGVDVSSGVEETPGRKNHDKVKAFVQGARKAAQEANKGF
jgi:anthranilate synthase/indole-3-glycerol phosphate synthase/phosphoribosylanthranilate isomerase